MQLSPAAIGIGAGLAAGATAATINGLLTHEMHRSDDPGSVLLPTATFFTWGVMGTLGGAIGLKMGGGALAAAALGAGIGSAVGGIAGLVIGTRDSSATPTAPGAPRSPFHPFPDDRFYA